MEQEKPTKKRIRIAFELPEALRNRVKIAAAMRNVHVNVIIVRALTEYLNKVER